MTQDSARRKRTWTADEDQIIKDTMGLKLADVADMLPGRTPGAVSDRRMVVSGSRKPIVTQTPTPPRGRPSSWLIAKTCPSCGQFLPAADFAVRSRGGRAHYCSRCAVRISRRHGDQGQAATTPAPHHYERWADHPDDLDLIMARDERDRPTISVQDAALLTGRTARAVQAARSKRRDKKGDDESHEQ